MKKTRTLKNLSGPKGSQFRFLMLMTMLLLIVIYGCKQDDNNSSGGLTPYEIIIPKGFPKMPIPEGNRPFAERIALGRRLYYDPILSNNGKSCSSCHFQDLGFTVNSQQGMPVLHHANLGWKEKFMWDGRKQGSLEEVMLFEVEEFFGTDISKLNKHPDYPDLFVKTYGVENITSQDVANALAQFFRVLISSDSKFDKVQRNEATFTADEAKGFDIFNSEKGSCFHCHTPPFFADNQLHNIGLDSIFDDPANQGYFGVSGDSSQLGAMRTANLRNLSLRSRFMHDGRFSTIEEVIEFYNSNVNRTPSLDPTMVKGSGSTKLNLTETEKTQLAAFLRTLTDSTFTSNPAFSYPH